MKQTKFLIAHVGNGTDRWMDDLNNERQPRYILYKKKLQLVSINYTH